jgi:two-component system cell cycle response regulator DivK
MSKVSPKAGGKSEICTPLILVAEANCLNRRLTCDLLKSRGYKVLEVANSRMIVEATRHNNPDLVLIDLSLPGLDVINIVRNIRLDEKLDHIPVLAVTNATINDDEVKEIQKEYDEVISKPIAVTTLMSKIDTILAKSHKYTIR